MILTIIHYSYWERNHSNQNTNTLSSLHTYIELFKIRFECMHCVIHCVSGVICSRV